MDPLESPDDLDAIEDLGDHIVILAGHLHAGMYRYLTLVERFDRLHGWELAGHRSCAHWIHARTGFDMVTAREHVRVARALRDLPHTSAAMAEGALSFSKVRAITRVAEPETEDRLVTLARGATTAQVELMMRAWRKGSREDEAAAERERYRSRMFSVFPDEDGMYLVRGHLMPEDGALLMRAIEAASDALYREARGSERGPEHGWRAEEETQAEAARRRADAVGLLAERALAAGFGAEGDPREAPISGSRAERRQVLLFVEEAALRAEESASRNDMPVTQNRDSAEASQADMPVTQNRDSAEASQADMPRSEGVRYPRAIAPALTAGPTPFPRRELADGTRLSHETARRLCCDASVVRVTRGTDGTILDLGRKTRTVTPALRRALEARDHGCRFPGCGGRFTSGHHLWHWVDGGPTNLANTLLLCRHHHRLVHEGGWTVTWWGEGRPVFIDPRGGEHVDAAWQPPGGHPAAERRDGVGRLHTKRGEEGVAGRGEGGIAGRGEGGRRRAGRARWGGRPPRRRKPCGGRGARRLNCRRALDAGAGHSGRDLLRRLGGARLGGLHQPRPPPSPLGNR